MRPHFVQVEHLRRQVDALGLSRPDTMQNHTTSSSQQEEQFATAASSGVKGTPSLLPLQPSFAGHGTFALRSGWLKKGLDALPNDPLSAPHGVDGSLFNSPEALSVLGVGKNMVGAIRYWLVTTRMAREEGKGRELRVEPLGQYLFEDDGWDPFLEDEATLWLLHYQLAGPRTNSFTWAYAFSCLRDWEFSRDGLVDAVLGAAHSLSKMPSRETVDRDVGCLLQTYVLDERSSLNEDFLDCPLWSLGLLRPSLRGQYRFLIEAKPSLPPAIFYCALATFWIWKHPDARTLSVWEACYSEGSPGLVFKLDETSVLNYLDGLSDATLGAVRFEDTAHNRQIVLEEDATIKPMAFLESYYANNGYLAA